MRFHNNTARYGASVLISGLDFCAFPDRDRGRVFRWNFVEFRYNGVMKKSGL